MINTWQLKQAARVVHAGGVIAYPTEAVYGLGCDPWQPEAVYAVLDMKQRPLAKGLILIAADTDQLRPFLAELTPAQWQPLDASWPGPVTWVVPARIGVPVWLRGAHDTIAVRVTAHPLAAALCRACGHALVSTSANVAGRPPARSRLRVRQQFQNQLDTILSGDLDRSAKPSTIRDLLSGKILRGG